MESPVVVDKPPEYHGSSNERGFPFDEEEGSSAWSELASRHPDIAARLRARPSTWARKRRPSSQDATDEFGGGFGEHFDRFPFDDIPPEFRDHFPTNWNRRFVPREEPPPPAPQPQPQPSPQHQTTSTQTDEEREPLPEQQAHLPQYGLRNTVDLGQKSPADPSLVDAEERNQRSMSAPPDGRGHNQNTMSGAQQPPQSQQHHNEHAQSNVRHIPIFVEGRDEPVINKSADHGAHYAEAKPNYAPPPVDREQYFNDDTPMSFHPPPNFSRAFGAPFSKGFRQSPQPFVQQKVYPQNAFARGNSPHRSQSPKPQPRPEDDVKYVPVHQTGPKKAEHTPSRAQQQAPPPPPPPQPQQQQPPTQQAQRPQTPPQPKPQPPSANDPITLILSIQTDVLRLMTDVENFTGTKADKSYIYLDEMLTRNLIKLDNIETEGKENIRQARKEAIRCIQKCIAVLEAKADNKTLKSPAPQDVEMNENQNENTTNGEMESKEATKEENAKSQTQAEGQQVSAAEDKNNVDQAQEAAPDTRPESNENPEANSAEASDKSKSTPKKGTKVVKKRDKSKDKVDKDGATVEGVMQVDEAGDSKSGENTKGMDVDAAAATSQ